MDEDLRTDFTALLDHCTQQLLRAPKMAEIVADHIRSRILKGELKEGDFLPPQHQVMASFDISRPTLREAFRILEAERFISTVRGSRSGARVHRPRVAGVARYAGFVLQTHGTTIGDIFDARLAIEPFIARRLAEAQPDGATDRLRVEADRLTSMVEGERYIEFMIALAQFHRVLVEVSGQRMLLFLTQVLQNVLARYQVDFFKRNLLDASEQRRRSMAGIRSFRKLINLIDAGDAAGAESHWRLHIINANASWVPTEHRDQVIDLLD